MITSKLKGHPIKWIKESQSWVYLDNGQPTVIGRPCSECGKSSVPEDGNGETDPCLGILPGVAKACCGHGTKSESYIQFKNGVKVCGFDVVISEFTGEHDAKEK